MELPDEAVMMALARLYRHLPAETEEELELVATLNREHPLASLDEAMVDLVATVADLHDLTSEQRFQGRDRPPRIAQGRPQRPVPLRERTQIQGLPRRELEPAMRLQLLSDLHLETEEFEPEPAADAELLVLAGDIDSEWHGLEFFRDWPVPVIFVAGQPRIRPARTDRSLGAVAAALRGTVDPPAGMRERRDGRP